MLHHGSGHQLAADEDGNAFLDIFLREFLKQLSAFIVEHDLHDGNVRHGVQRDGCRAEMLAIQLRVLPACRLEREEERAQCNGFLRRAHVARLQTRKNRLGAVGCANALHHQFIVARSVRSDHLCFVHANQVVAERRFHGVADGTLWQRECGGIERGHHGAASEGTQASPLCFGRTVRFPGGKRMEIRAVIQLHFQCLRARQCLLFAAREIRRSAAGSLVCHENMARFHLLAARFKEAQEKDACRSIQE